MSRNLMLDYETSETPQGITFPHYLYALCKTKFTVTALPLDRMSCIITLIGSYSIFKRLPAIYFEN